MATLLLQRSSRVFHLSLRPFLRSASPSLLDSSQTSELDRFAFDRGSSTLSGSSRMSSQGKPTFFSLSSILGAAAFYSVWQTQTASDQAHTEAERTALNPNDWVQFKLHETKRVSPNTKIYRFTFNDDEKLGLEIASCLITRAQLGKKADGKPNHVIRPYTPISPPNSKGYFDLMVKVYPDGKMSQHIDSLKPGDTLEVKGPISKLPYKPNMKKNIGMIAGGTGITPMLQIIDAILNNKDDNTKVSLVYGNLSPDDILLKEKLDVLAATHPNFKVYYVVNKPTEGWKGGAGHISKDVILKGLPEPADDTIILVCGPPGLMKHISGDKAPDKSQGEVSGLLKDAGYSKEMVFKF